MTLYERLRTEGSALSIEAADALLQQAEDKQLLAAQNEQLKYRVDTMREYIDDLEGRVPHGNKATNNFV